MSEENKETATKKWTRIFKKKWFFPALYIGLAAVLLTFVLWYQNISNQMPDANREFTDNLSPYDEDAEPVLDQQEVIKMPVADEAQTEIVTKFFDYDADKKDQENGLILYNNRYYQSTGVDIATKEEDAFDVVASLSGTITEVKEDPLLGNIVVISHENDVMTYYASLGEVDVKTGAQVKQGDKIGVAGKNLFGKDNGTHVHFEIRKDGQEVNPELFFNQPVSKLDEIKAKESEKPVSEDQEANEEATEDEAVDDEKPSEATEDEAEDDEKPSEAENDKASESENDADEKQKNNDKEEKQSSSSR